MKAAPVLVPDIAALLQALAVPRQAGADLRLDSRDVRPGDVFVAVAGATTHGRDFIAQAVAAGAVAVLVDGDDADAQTTDFALELESDAPGGEPQVLNFTLADVERAKLNPVLNFKGKKR